MKQITDPSPLNKVHSPFLRISASLSPRHRPTLRISPVNTAAAAASSLSAFHMLRHSFDNNATKIDKAKSIYRSDKLIGLPSHL